MWGLGSKSIFQYNFANRKGDYPSILSSTLIQNRYAPTNRLCVMAIVFCYSWTTTEYDSYAVVYLLV